MFNKELFYALCDKYGVELSNQYQNNCNTYKIKTSYMYAPQELMIA